MIYLTSLGGKKKKLIVLKHDQVVEAVLRSVCGNEVMFLLLET